MLINTASLRVSQPLSYPIWGHVILCGRLFGALYNSPHGPWLLYSLDSYGTHSTNMTAKSVILLTNVPWVIKSPLFENACVKSQI